MSPTPNHEGHIRSQNARNNGIRSLVYKGIQMICLYIQVPLLLSCLGETDYGIWVTLNSVIFYLNFLDLGLTHGLKYRLAISIAHNDKILSRELVSTAFFMNFFIFWGVFLISGIIYKFAAYNFFSDITSNTTSVFFCIFLSFSINMILSVANTVQQAYQNNSYSELIKSFSSVVTLIIVFLTTLFFPNANLISYCAILSFTPTFFLFISFIYVFFIKYPCLVPTPKCFKSNRVRSIMSLGINFFMIQICLFIILNATNFILGHRCGFDQVAVYNVCHQYFFVIMTITNIVATPYWVAFTDAYTKQDFSWMKNRIVYLTYTWGIISLISLLMLLLSPIAYKLWLGEKMKIDFSISAGMCICAIMTALSSVYTMLINGTGKIRLQLYIYAAFSIIIPLAMYLAPPNILYFTTIQTIFYFVLSGAMYIQLQKIVNKNAHNIWKR